MNPNEIPLLPAPDILNEFEGGKFALSNLAAKRARQIKDGAPPMVRVDSNNALTIALTEIAQGKVKAKFPPEQPPAIAEEVGAEVVEAVPQLGLLLPALEAEEVEIIKTLEEGDAHEETLEEEEAVPAETLTDLLAEDHEEAEEAALADEPTLSLTDIAEQESAEGEDEETEE
jgi:DNA-directed RNA polymerase subunit omega